MRYQVWSRPVVRVFSTSLLSWASVFHLIITLLTFIPPLLIAYRSQGFWMRQATYEEQPEIHFRHELVVLARTREGQQLGWATAESVNNFLMENVRIPLVTSREEDVNRDGLLDNINLQVKIPLDKSEEIVSVSLILLFDVKLHKFSSVSMTGLIYLQGSGWPGYSYQVLGDINIRQRQPLAHRGRDTRYLQSPIPEDSEMPEDFYLPTILANYAERNLTIRLADEFTLWSPGPGSDHFTATVNLKYPSQSLTYRPGFWQVLKWGWVQYLSLLLLFLWAAAAVRSFVFSNQILPTLISFDDK